MQEQATEDLEWAIFSGAKQAKKDCFLGVQALYTHKENVEGVITALLFDI